MLIVIASTFLCRFLVVDNLSDSCNVAQKHLLPTTIHSAFYLHFTVLLALL